MDKDYEQAIFGRGNPRSQEIYKQLVKIITREMQLIISNLNRVFSKDIHMVNKHTKRCSTSLVMKEMKIKTTMRYQFTPIRMSTIKKTENNKY